MGSQDSAKEEATNQLKQLRRAPKPGLRSWTPRKQPVVRTGGHLALILGYVPAPASRQKLHQQATMSTLMRSWPSYHSSAVQTNHRAARESRERNFVKLDSVLHRYRIVRRCSFS